MNQLVLDAIRLAIIPAISLTMPRRPTVALHKRIANPGRMQAINYHRWP